MVLASGRPSLRSLIAARPGTPCSTIDAPQDALVSIMDRRGRPVSQRLMEPLVVVERQVLSQPLLCLHHRLISVQVNVLVFDRPPQPLRKNVVEGATAGVPADSDVPLLQTPDDVVAGELAALIRVEDVGSALFQGLVLP